MFGKKFAINLPGKIHEIAIKLRAGSVGILAKKRRPISAFHITNSQWNGKISETRDIEPSEIHDMEPVKN